VLYTVFVKADPVFAVHLSLKDISRSNASLNRLLRSSTAIDIEEE